MKINIVGTLKFIFYTFFISISLLFLYSCGGDETGKLPSEKENEATNIDITKEKLLGIWDVREINSIPVEIFLESVEGEDLEEQEVQIENFSFVFMENNSFSINLEFGNIFTFPKVPQDPGLFLPDGKILVVGEWSGIYSVEDSKLTFTADEVDVTIDSEPDEFILQAFEVQSEEDAQLDYIEAFNTYILTPFKESTGSFKRNELFLITPLAKKMVLEKR